MADNNAITSTSSTLSNALLYLYIGICLVVLSGHSLDTVLNIRGASDDQVDFVIEEVLKNHPAEISASWASHEVLRLRRFSQWFNVHTVPVVVWLILSVTQISPSFRKHNIQRHKKLGNLMLLTSSVMLLGIAALVIHKEEIYGTEFSLSNPFTFGSWTVVGGLWWIICGVQGYRTASRGDIQSHKHYMYHFLANGYSTGTARLIIFSYLLYYYPKGGPTAMETPELNWLVDLSAWASLVSNSIGAEVCLWAFPSKSNKAKST